MAYNIIKESKKQGVSAYLIVLLLTFFCITLLVNIFKLSSQYWQIQKILAGQQTKKTQLEIENQQLNYEIKKKQTESYIEEKAREFSLAKKGEYVILANEPTPTNLPTPTVNNKKPNYQLWFELFYHQ